MGFGFLLKPSCCKVGNMAYCLTVVLGDWKKREDLRKLFLCLAGGNFFSRNVPWSYVVFLTSKLMPPNRAVSFPEELGRELKL